MIAIFALSKSRRRFACGLACLAVSACASVQDANPTELVFATADGPIVIALETEKAPLSTSFVIRLAEQGRFEGHSFYRAGSGAGKDRPVELIEGGLLDTFIVSKKPTSLSATGLPTLAQIETTDMTGLSHKRGAVSLARDVLDTGQAIPDIVIYLVDAPDYDAGGSLSPDGLGYPVFGYVSEGLDILDALAQADRTAETWVQFLQGQILYDPLVIEAVDIN